MEDSVKGTVTSISSIFPAEEAQKAAKRVHDSISERQKELGHINRFIADNTNLINLVQKLPDELFHEVMVPFGKAAFFPGRLIHTNEFLVLLGEGYYAERTAKQTIEILQRREKVLESQVHTLKNIMLDLKAEASFFDATATEAAEGLVEIREEYPEENSSEGMSKSGVSRPNFLGSSESKNMKVAAEDEEYARILSRLDELEKEELAAGSANEDSEEEADADTGFSISSQSSDQYLKISEEQKQMNPLQQSKDNKLFNTTAKYPSNVYKEKFDELEPQLLPKDELLRGKSLAYNSSSMEKPLLLSESIEKAQIRPPSKTEVPKDHSESRTSKTSTDSFKAFTGSIVEHSNEIKTNPMGHTSASSKLTGSNPSKPVSRFKMQKGSR